MPKKPPVHDGPDLFDLLDEQENGPKGCPHRYAVSVRSGHGWRHQTDPSLPHFGEWVHSDPRCALPAHPGSSVQIPPRVGWSRELQKDVPLAPA